VCFTLLQKQMTTDAHIALALQTTKQFPLQCCKTVLLGSEVVRTGPKGKMGAIMCECILPGRFKSSRLCGKKKELTIFYPYFLKQGVILEAKERPQIKIALRLQAGGLLR